MYPEKTHTKVRKEKTVIQYGIPARVFSVLYVLVLMLTPVCAFVGTWREDFWDNCDATLVRSECFGVRKHLHEWGDDDTANGEVAFPTSKQTTVAIIALIVLIFDSIVRLTAAVVCIVWGHPDIGISPWAAFASSLLGFIAVITVGVGWKLEYGGEAGWGFYCCLVQAILDLLIGIVLLCLRLCRKKKKKPVPRPRPRPQPEVVPVVIQDTAPPEPIPEPMKLTEDAGLKPAIEAEPEPPLEWRHASSFNQRHQDKDYANFGGGVFGTKGELLHHQTIQNVSPHRQQKASVNTYSSGRRMTGGAAASQYEYSNPYDGGSGYGGGGYDQHHRGNPLNEVCSIKGDLKEKKETALQWSDS